MQPRVTGESFNVGDPGTVVFTTYPKVVNFVLKRYATDDLIADANAKCIFYKQNTGTSEMELSQELLIKALRCGNFYSERRLKSLIVEELLPLDTWEGVQPP